MNDFVVSLMMLGALGSSGSLPFWMTANRYGIMPEESGALAVLSAGSQYDESKAFQWKWGATLALNSYYGFELSETPRHIVSPHLSREADVLYPTENRQWSSNIIPDELYVSAKWLVFNLDLGMKHLDKYFMAPGTTLGSVSSTSGRICWSGNARTMPGYNAYLDPVPVPFTWKHLWIYGQWGDYITTDKRYVQNALVHHMLAAARLDVNSRLSFHVGVDHYAFWGGTSPLWGKFDISLPNYLRVAAGQSSAVGAWSTSDQINVLGDHRGGEFIRANWEGDGWSLCLQHDIPYDDKSGMSLHNFPDGVNSIVFSRRDRTAWVTDVAYEYHYTMWQSGTWHDKEVSDDIKETQDPSSPYYGRIIVGGLDNYFNNEDYMSGWTHYGMTIGDPLFYPYGTHENLWTSKDVTIGMDNNRIKAHHLGVGGYLFGKYPYRLMLTYSKNYGTYYEPYVGEGQIYHEWGTVNEKCLRQFSSGFDVECPVKPGLMVVGGLFADAGQVLGNKIGAMLGIRYEFSK